MRRFWLLLLNKHSQERLKIDQINDANEYKFLHLIELFEGY
jgi:hypothetical protein